MKNSSMNMAPKGRIPAIRILQSKNKNHKQHNLTVWTLKIPCNYTENSKQRLYISRILNFTGNGITAPTVEDVPWLQVPVTPNPNYQCGLKEPDLPSVHVQRATEGDTQQPKGTERRGLNSPYFPDTHHSPHKFVHIPPLLRDLPGNLICPYRIVIRLLAKSKVVTQVDQGQGDPKPHAEQGHHGRERHLESHQEPQK